MPEFRDVVKTLFVSLVCVFGWWCMGKVVEHGTIIQTKVDMCHQINPYISYNKFECCRAWCTQMDTLQMTICFASDEFIGIGIT